MLSYSEASKRLVCVAPLEQLLLEILIYLRAPEYLLDYACPGMYVCMYIYITHTHTHILVCVCVCVCAL
jgi:hypothetical protein